MLERKRIAVWFWRVVPTSLLILFLGACLPVRDSGRWICGVCGRHERQTRIAGLTVTVQREPSPYYLRYLAVGGPEHAHDWVRTGCHTHGGLFLDHSIGCSINGDWFFLQSAVAGATDDAWVRRVADRLLSLSPEQRRDELKDSRGLNVTLSRLVERMNAGKHESVQSSSDFWIDLGDFEEYSAWWRTHPSWQGLFPNPGLP